MKIEASMGARIFRALGAEALGQTLNIGIRLVLVPLFLSAWGAEAYGEWLILTAIAAWFGLGDFGSQVYFVNRLTASWAAGKKQEFQKILSTGLVLFLSLATILVAFVAFCLSMTSSLSWLGIQAMAIGQAKLILLIMALRFLAALPVGLLMGVYRATGAQATSVMYGNLMLLIQLIGSAIALIQGAGMIVLALLEIVPILIVAILVIINLSKHLSGIRILTIKNVDKKILIESISPSLHFLGIQFAMAVMIQGTVIAVAKSLGPIEVAIFSSMRTVSNVVSRVIAMLSHASWPEFTRLASLKEDEKLTHLFMLILFGNLLIGVGYLFVLQNYGELLFGWWLNHKLPYDPISMFLMGAFVIPTAMWTLGGNLLMATNSHEEFAILQIPVNFFALFLCYFGSLKFGLPGAVLGLIVGQAVIMILIVTKLLKQKGWDTNAKSLLKVSTGAVLLISMCINYWSGLLSIVLTTALVANKFGWIKIQNYRKPAPL